MMVGWSMGLEGWALMAIWVAVLVGAVWLLVRTPSDRPEREDALAVLRARFARGDISQDEFERGRDALLAGMKGRRS